MAIFRSPTGAATLGPVPSSVYGAPRTGHSHQGDDLGPDPANPLGRRHPLYAPRGGRIDSIRISTGVGGKVAEIAHGRIRGREHRTRHFHLGTKTGTLDAAVTVDGRISRVGDRLDAGEPFALIGDSGNAIGLHDHYEHWIDGAPQDPLPWLAEYQTRLSRGYGLIYPGSAGDEARLLQVLLLYHGFFPGPIDGIFGAATEASLERFQAARDLTPDGVAGRRTWAALLPRPV